MTGTSLDGLDVALVRITGRGLDMKATHLASISKPLGELGSALRLLAQGQPAPPIDYLRAARALGELHAQAIRELMDTCPARLDFIVAHGQTIWHEPQEFLSWQLLDPWPINRAIGVPICYDLRQADLIAGGQGAPITPLADLILYGSHQGIINLGGICNITYTGIGSLATITGQDICHCNLLLDSLVQLLHPSLPYDIDGKIAAAGRIDPRAVTIIADHLRALNHQRQSLGRENMTPAALAVLAAQLRIITDDASIITCATRAIASVIIDHAAGHGANQLILAGGGARNPVLVEHLRSQCEACGSAAPSGRMTLMLSDEVGIPCQSREAIAFAVLGALCQDGVPITLPQVTGATNPGIAGVWVGGLTAGLSPA